MIKNIILFFSLIILSFANEKFCYDLNPSPYINNNDVKIYSYYLHNNISQVKVKKDLTRNRLFAKEYLKHYKLSKKVKTLIKLNSEKLLALLYIEKLKESNKPSDKVLRSYFLDHKDAFKPLQKISVTTIAVKSLKKADEIYLKLKRHPNLFEKFVKKYSEDPSKDSGGHYKDISIDKFTPLVREWIREHKVGEISQPLKVGLYYFIDRMDAKKEVKVTYDSLKENMKKILEALYIKGAIQKEFKKLKQKYGVK